MFEMRRNAGDAFISSPVVELGDKKQMLKKRRPQGAQQPQRWRFGNRNDQCFRVMWDLVVQWGDLLQITNRGYSRFIY